MIAWIVLTLHVSSLTLSEEQHTTLLRHMLHAHRMVSIQQDVFFGAKDSRHTWLFRWMLEHTP